MSLKEREGPVRKLQDELKVVGAQKLALCLAGKILSTDLVNREAFRSQISRIWKLRGDVEIEVITSNIYAFHFQLADDRRNVLAGGPWSFDDALIVLEEPTGMGAIKGLKFNLAEFWVQISDLPILCMTKEIGCFLGSIIGDVREVDTGPSGDCLGEYLRVRVAIQIDKPLRRFLRVDVLGDGEETVMPIQYERLPNFCFRCGLLGHTVRGCPEVEEGGIVDDQVLQYGAWLKATGKLNQPNQPVQRGRGSYSHSRSKAGSWRTSTLVEDVRQYKQQTMVGASNPSADESFGNLDGNSLGRGRGRGKGRGRGGGKYSYNVSQGSGSKNLNDKHNLNLVYRSKIPDFISNSAESEGQPESKGAVASDSVYRGDHHPLSAHSDSQNIQWGVSRLEIEETPQKEAEGSATKNLYLHKEELTYMQEESPQLLKHLNDKKLVYQPKSKRPDLIPNSVEAEGSHKKNPERKGVVASEPFYRGGHRSLSAYSDSQIIQWAVSKTTIAETPQKKAEASAAKNLYLHKEKVTYMQEESPPQLPKHLNDKNNSKSVYQPERKGVVASESVYTGGHCSLSAHSDSQNIKLAVSKTTIAETPQKQAEGSATKNLYLHKEKVTNMQEESPQPLKVGIKGQTSEEKGSKNSTCIGDSGHSEQEAGFKLDLCPPKKGSPFMLNPPLLVKNRQKRNEVKRATEGQIGNVLRPGMVLLKNFLSFSDQVNILKTCRDLGLGPGGFYQPGYRKGASMHLKMMCLGKNWDPEKKMYEDIRSMDGATLPTIPAEFNQLVEKAIHDSCALIERNHGLRNAAYKLPPMSPDICIVNFYSATGKLSLHQDRDETQESPNKGLPVVSFSVGNTAEFLYGDERDVDKATKVPLESGDVLIFGGKSRHIFHGVEAILPNTTPHALLEETNFRPGRLNLTFRQY